MKKHLFLTVTLSVLFIFNGMAQHSDALNKQMKGPAAKNYKPWENSEKSAKTILVTQYKQLKGPKAKNHKPWNNDCERYPMAFVDRKDLKGPKAKNTRPFEHVQIDTMLIVQEKK